MNFYELLGVPRGADDASIRSAYRALARRHHPDLHGQASAKVQAANSRKMAAISEAYEVLSDPRARPAYDRQLDGSRSSSSYSSPPPPPRRPSRRADQCEFCGSGPVRTIHLRRNVGLLLTRRRFGGDVTACRGCGLAMFRQFQNSTMAKGWWGPISFFINIGCVLSNTIAWLKIASLDDPVLPTSPVEVPFSRPMPPGPLLLRRGGIWITVVLFFFLANHVGGQTPAIPQVSTSYPVITHPTTTTLEGRSLSDYPMVGDCVAKHHGKVDRIVDCGGPHFAMIVKLTLARNDCPRLSDLQVEEPFGSPRSGWIVCLSSDG